MRGEPCSRQTHRTWAPSAGGAYESHSAAAAVNPSGENASAPDQPAAIAPLPASTSDFRAAVSAYEQQLLEDALRRNRFNQRATAAALGLSYDQLRHALKRHKLQDSAG